MPIHKYKVKFDTKDGHRCKATFCSYEDAISFANVIKDSYTLKSIKFGHNFLWREKDGVIKL